MVNGSYLFRVAPPCSSQSASESARVTSCARSLQALGELTIYFVRVCDYTTLTKISGRSTETLTTTYYHHFMSLLFDHVRLYLLCAEFISCSVAVSIRYVICLYVQLSQLCCVCLSFFPSFIHFLFCFFLFFAFFLFFLRSFPSSTLPFESYRKHICFMSKVEICAPVRRSM